MHRAVYLGFRNENVLALIRDRDKAKALRVRCKSAGQTLLLALGVLAPLGQYDLALLLQL